MTEAAPQAANLAHFLAQTARRFPDRAGLIRGDERWTWSVIADRVGRAAAALTAMGVGPGDRIIVHARNSLALFETMWAAWTIGAVFVPTNARLTPAEVAYLAESASPAAQIVDAAYPEHATSMRAANPELRAELWIGGDAPTAWDRLATGPQPPSMPVAVGRDHPAWFFYTSGTTGRPKAAVLTHGQLAFVVTNHLADLLPGIDETDTALVVAPLSHGAGIHAMLSVARGAASVLMGGDRLDVEEAWSLVERHRVTNMFTVPTILTMLTRHDAVGRCDHASLRYVIYAGAPMYRADQVHALRMLGPVLVQYFGLGEVTGAITVLPPRLHSLDDESLAGSCGYPRTGIEIAILDESGRALAPGETGEICVRGPAVFAGYYGNKSATEAAFRHGWFHTGDVGHLNTQGFLFITGRASDMYISGGSNVYPREIEEALLTHEAVAEACVVGLPHPKWGECGVAVIVPAPGAAMPDAAALLAHLDGKLARYKLPTQVVVWDALPRSGYGKVVKRDVRARLEAEDVVEAVPAGGHIAR
jgi:fatty-acyl-CoA synthase